MIKWTFFVHLQYKKIAFPSESDQPQFKLYLKFNGLINI